MQQKKGQKGFSLIELLIVVAIIGVIAAIAIPNLLASRRAANESASIGTMRTIVTANATFFSTVGNNKDYADLPGLKTAALIDNVLGASNTPTKGGYAYNFTLDGTKASYTVTADPSSASTGTRYFFTDESGVIRTNSSKTATATDNAIQ